LAPQRRNCESGYLVLLAATLCQWASISGKYPRRIVQNHIATRFLQTAICFQACDVADFHMPTG
jgi:hypothetical protein